MSKNTAVVVNRTSKSSEELMDSSISLVGQNIMRLEKRLNARLLRKSTRPVRFNDTGRIHYERARDIQDQVESLESKTRIYGIR